MSERIVITGLGVVSPNGVGVSNFLKAIRLGSSGIEARPELEQMKFRCQVGGIPPLSDSQIDSFLQRSSIRQLKSSGILYGCMAAEEAWNDAGLPVNRNHPDWTSGCFFGTGSNGIEATREGFQLAYAKRVREGDPTIPQQAMNSGVSAYIGGMLGLGNKVSSNSSACNTGTEGILMAFDYIRNGLAERMLVGSSESGGAFVWGPFDSMFATAQGYNSTPKQASRPLSIHAAGFVPAAGAGALVLENLNSARKRNARIYAEVLGGNINSGGHRGDGTMTIGNSLGMIRCIKTAMSETNIGPADIDLISGHLSSTIGDIKEILAWKNALGLVGKDFPYINAMKSMIGHCLSASGSIESVASVLELYHDFIHPSINAEELHPQIEEFVDRSKVPLKTREKANINVLAKVSLGFGDVNSCIMLKKWTE